MRLQTTIQQRAPARQIDASASHAIAFMLPLAVACFAVFGDRQGVSRAIPPAWALVVVNPKQATERRAHVQRQIAKLRAPLVRFVESPLIPELGLLGCLEGHRRAYKWVAQQPPSLQYAVVVEDDIEIDDNTAQLRKFLSWESMAPRLARYPLIQLFYANQGHQEYPVVPPGPIFSDVCQSNGFLTSLLATVVSREYASFVHKYLAHAVPLAINNYFQRKKPMWTYDADVLLSRIQKQNNHGAWCPGEKAVEYSHSQHIRLSSHNDRSMNQGGRERQTADVTEAYLKHAVSS